MPKFPTKMIELHPQWGTTCSYFIIVAFVLLK